MNFQSHTAPRSPLSVPALFIRLVVVLGIALGLTLSGCDGAGAQIEVDPVQVDGALVSTAITTWKLPKPLREVSGLATSKAGLIYAVADERATVFVLNPASGETVAVFDLGDPVVKGDFEGIARHNNWLYLIASNGQLLRTAVGDDSQADGTARRFDSFSLSTGCQEIEGLASDPAAELLWIVCKEIAATADQRDMMVIRLEAWSVGLQRLLPESVVELPLAGVLALTGQKKFKPSGLAFVPTAGVGEDSVTLSQRAIDKMDLLIISGAQRAYSRWRWSSEGALVQPRLVSAGRLSVEHRQPEGVAAGAEGTLLIADEGAGKRGRLRVYPEGALR